MKIQKIACIFFISALILGCKKDDDTSSVKVRDYAEVAVENDAEIVKFLESHFYYLDEEENPDEDADNLNEIIIDTLAGDNATKTPLIDQVSTKTIKVEDVNHTLYYIIVREGDGEQPSSSANVFARYKGLTLDKERFDVSTVGSWLPILGNGHNIFGVVRGFRELASMLKTGTGFEVNPDNSITWNDNYGMGIVFMPSALGYYESPPIASIIRSYEPIIFTMNMLQFEEVDYDFQIVQRTYVPTPDGILSNDEDVDGDGYPENDDTDGDGNPNYTDPDDDGDGILTLYEYDVNEDGIPDDADGDGIPAYLDADE